MKKSLKIIKLILFVIVFVLVISFINHQICLKREEYLFVVNGELVEVNGYNMHVFTEGQGDKTLIFMAGGGTSSPVYDFKTLSSLLSDNYKIVIVEKLGYGFSDVKDVDRDLDSILSDTREALSKLSISGPYVLVPHSMSGLEALYWAQEYPEEVEAIVGLDMSVPNSYEDYEVNKPLLTLGSYAAKLGITRFIPNITENEAILYGNLSEDEKEIVRAIFYRRTATITMLNEVMSLKDNASKIYEVNVPILIFSSNGENTGWKKDQWKSLHQEFVDENDNVQLIHLDCSHYVHNIEFETISIELKTFIDNLP